MNANLNEIEFVHALRREYCLEQRNRLWENIAVSLEEETRVT